MKQDLEGRWAAKRDAISVDADVKHEESHRDDRKQEERSLFSQFQHSVHDNKRMVTNGHPLTSLEQFAE